jgi:hypothetical protein
VVFRTLLHFNQNKIDLVGCYSAKCEGLRRPAIFLDCELQKSSFLPTEPSPIVQFDFERHVHVFLVTQARCLKEPHEVRQICRFLVCPQVRMFTLRYYLTYLDEISNWGFYPKGL